VASFVPDKENQPVGCHQDWT